MPPSHSAPNNGAAYTVAACLLIAVVSFSFSLAMRNLHRQARHDLISVHRPDPATEPYIVKTDREAPPRYRMVIGFAGEWITDAGTGAQVCQLSRDLNIVDQLDPRAWCDHWKARRPVGGEAILHFSSWLQCQRGFCLVHFEDGWRPQ